MRQKPSSKAVAEKQLLSAGASPTWVVLPLALPGSLFPGHQEKGAPAAVLSLC